MYQKVLRRSSRCSQLTSTEDTQNKLRATWGVCIPVQVTRTKQREYTLTKCVGNHKEVLKTLRHNQAPMWQSDTPVMLRTTRAHSLPPQEVQVHQQMPTTIQEIMISRDSLSFAGDTKYPVARTQWWQELTVKNNESGIREQLGFFRTN